MRTTFRSCRQCFKLTLITALFLHFAGCRVIDGKFDLSRQRQIRLESYALALKRVAAAYTEDDQLAAIEAWRRIPVTLHKEVGSKEPTFWFFNENGLFFPPGLLPPLEVKYVVVADVNTPTAFLPILVRFKGPRAASLFLLED